MSNAAIREAMEREGAPEPFFVSQRPRRGSRLGDFYRHWSRQGYVTRGRTGEGVRKGLVDFSPLALVEQANRMQGLLNAHRGWRRFLDVTALRRDDGELFTVRTRRDAERVRADLEALPGRFEWEIVRVEPWRGRELDAEGVLRLTEPDGRVSQQVADILSAALEGAGDGPFALVPKAAVDRMHAHVRALGAGPLSRAFRAVTGAFAKVVLSTSTSWMAGNAIEGQFRAAVARATPLDAVLAARVFRELARVDREAALRARVAGRPGGHMAFAARQVRLVGDHFDRANPVAARAAHRLADFMNRPEPATLARAWRGYTDFVFKFNEVVAEAYPQLALAGAWMRRRYRLGMRVSETAIRQAAEGLRNTPEQAAMARFVREAYGQYASFSPAMRRAKQFMPFFAWAHNAARFLYVVLPRDHPALTGLLAAVNIGSQEWLRAHGLDRSAPNAKPAFLLGSVPVAGGLVRASRHLPFQLAMDPTQTLADLLIPQFSNALDAFEGRDWRGNKLRTADGREYSTEQRALYALKEFLLGVTPFAARVDQFLNAEGGVLRRLRAVVDPYRAVGRAGEGGGDGLGPEDRMLLDWPGRSAADEGLDEVDRILMESAASEGDAEFDAEVDRILMGAG